MTELEKVKTLQNYCANKEDCADCVLKGTHWSAVYRSLNPCLDFEDASEEDLDKALELIGYVKPTVKEMVDKTVDTVDKTVDEIEVKRDALRHYCGNNDCETCPLVNHTWSNWIPNALYTKCLDLDHANDDEVLHAYDLICRSYAPNESVNHPKHYNKGTIEVIDYIEDQGLGFHLGNAVKYISRAGDKDPEKIDEDIRKAIWYLERFRYLIKKGKSNND